MLGRKRKKNNTGKRKEESEEGGNGGERDGKREGEKQKQKKAQTAIRMTPFPYRILSIICTLFFFFFSFFFFPSFYLQNPFVRDLPSRGGAGILLVRSLRGTMAVRCRVSALCVRVAITCPDVE